MSQCSTAGPDPLKGAKCATGPTEPVALEPIAVSLNDARALSGLSRSTLYIYINSGLLSDCTLGGKRLVIYSELKSLIMSGIKPAAFVKENV